MHRNRNQTFFVYSLKFAIKLNQPGLQGPTYSKFNIKVIHSFSESLQESFDPEDRSQLQREYFEFCDKCLRYFIQMFVTKISLDKLTCVGYSRATRIILLLSLLNSYGYVQ
jgi:hypothetical protein